MPDHAKSLILEVDGASRGNPGPAALGVVIKDAKGRVLKEVAEYIGRVTNNVAEYRALLRALDEARAMGASRIVIRSDSELLVSQLDGTYKVRSPDLSPLYLEATRLLRSFTRWSTERVPRGRNTAADSLANRAIDLAVPETAVELSALIEPHGRAFIARVPALPGVEGRGATRSAALEAAREAAIERLKELHAQGKPLPKEERIRVRLTGGDVD